MKDTFYIVLSLAFFLLGCKRNAENAGNAPIVHKTLKKVLFVVSNAHYYGESEINASNHFAEIVHAYDEFKKAGFGIDFLSPEGGAVPIGYLNTSDSLQKKYIYDNGFMDALETTKNPNEIEASDYRALYYGGGGAAMFGVAENEEIQRIAMEVYEGEKGIISAICHGTAGIVNLKTKDGKFVIAQKKVNGFPDLFENTEAAYYKTFPFSIQQKITEHGGTFEFSSKGWDGFMIADGRVITGQDPSAAALVAKKIIETLKNNISN